jgi:hypothetical protein
MGTSPRAGKMAVSADRRAWWRVLGRGPGPWSAPATPQRARGRWPDPGRLRRCDIDPQCVEDLLCLMLGVLLHGARDLSW